MRTAETRGVAWAFWAHAENLRTHQDLTVAELCRRADIRRQTYSELRRTTRRPQRYIVLSIADVLNMGNDKALALSGLTPTDSDTVREAILRAHDLNDVQKRSLLALLDVYDAEDAPAPATKARPVKAAPVALFKSSAAVA